MRSKKYIAALMFALIYAPSSAWAAPRTYFWGQMTDLQGMSFHRQANNVSEFHATLPMRCDFTDGTSDQVEASISGAEVPNMLVGRNGRLTAEFSTYIDGVLADGDVEVTALFRGNRAIFSVVVNSNFSDGTCYGGIVFSRVRRGARIRQ